jgi:hypothetical protein
VDLLLGTITAAFVTDWFLPLERDTRDADVRLGKKRLTATVDPASPDEFTS